MIISHLSACIAIGYQWPSPLVQMNLVSFFVRFNQQASITKQMWWVTTKRRFLCFHTVNENSKCSVVQQSVVCILGIPKQYNHFSKESTGCHRFQLFMLSVVPCALFVWNYYLKENKHRQRWQYLHFVPEKKKQNSVLE